MNEKVKRKKGKGKGRKRDRREGKNFGKGDHPGTVLPLTVPI